MRTFIHALLLVAMLIPSAQAAEVITCTGKLSETATLAVVVDPAGYTCTVHLRGSGHDPMRPCSVGDACRLTGRGHRTGTTGKTYVIDQIIAVDPVDPAQQSTHAADRLPDQLLGCWKWSNGTKLDAIYKPEPDHCRRL
jgi:hypothetical protein